MRRSPLVASALLVAIAALGATPHFLHAQAGSVAGTVVASGSQRPLAGVQVGVVGQAGKGATTDGTGRFSIADLASALLSAVDGQFAYAGVSLGGAVGLQLLLSAPDRVTSATLLSTGGRIGTPAGWRDRAARVRREGVDCLLADTPIRWFAPANRSRERFLCGTAHVGGHNSGAYGHIVGTCAGACELGLGRDDLRLERGRPQHQRRDLRPADRQQRPGVHRRPARREPPVLPLPLGLLAQPRRPSLRRHARRLPGVARAVRKAPAAAPQGDRLLDKGRAHAGSAAAADDDAHPVVAPDVRHCSAVSSSARQTRAGVIGRA